MQEMKQQSAPNEPAPPQAITFDAILPPAMALRAEESGVKRASADPVTLLVLSVVAGAFISFGAIFATTVTAGSIGVTAADGTWVSSATLPYGIGRLLIGLVFSVGLIMVIIAGAELFTGNNIIVMAWASGKVKTRALLLNWVLSFSGNFVGAILTAVLMFYTTQYTFGSGTVGLVALNTANAKASLALSVMIAAVYWFVYLRKPSAQVISD
jgi:formate/nitrite transporter FocA (FNT family)